MPSLSIAVSGLACLSLLASATPFATLKHRELSTRAPSTISGWDYSGCFKDTTTARVLDGASYSSDTMTVERCASFCGDRGFPVFGVEWSRECFCDNSLRQSISAPEEDCNFKCSGKDTESCGAGDRLDVYHKQVTATTTSTTTSPTPLPTSYTFQNCYSEATTGRALALKYSTSDAQTVANCAASCAGYKYFGLEYYFECFCGNELGAGSIPVGGVECSYPCTGDATQTCGASNRLSVYSFGDNPPPSVPSPSTTAPTTVPTELPGITSVGCFSDSTTSRSLKGAVFFDDLMTIEKCATVCDNYEVFGVEYGRECFCGNALEGSAEVLSTQCNMPCSGNGAQICGAGDRLNVYKFGTVATSSTVESTSSSTTTTSEATTSTTTSTSTTTTIGATVAPTPAPVSPNTNIIQNPSFENDLTFWTVEKVGAVSGTSVEIGHAKEGVHGFHFYSGYLNEDTGFSLKQAVSVIPGSAYTVEFWVYLFDGVFFTTASLNGVPVAIAPANSYPQGTWTLVQGQFNIGTDIPSTTVLFELKIVCPEMYTHQGIVVDNIRVMRVLPTTLPTPTTTTTTTTTTGTTTTTTTTTTQTPSLTSANLILNPGFETGLAPWFITGQLDATHSISTSGAKEGNQYFRATTSSGSGLKILQLLQEVIVVPGTYALDFSMNRHSGACDVWVDMNNENLNYWPADSPAAGVWTAFHAEVVLPSNVQPSVILLFRFLCEDMNQGDFGLDDFKFLPVTPTSPPAPTDS